MKKKGSVKKDKNTFSNERREALKRIARLGLGAAAGSAFLALPGKAHAGYGVSGDYVASGGYGVSGDYVASGGYGVSGDYTDRGGYGVSGDYSDSNGYGVSGNYSDNR